MPTKIFNNLKMTENEDEFVSNILRDDKQQGKYNVTLHQGEILATLRLAKEVEESRYSSDKSSKAMNRLTGALVFLGFCQVAVVVVGLIVN